MHTPPHQANKLNNMYCYKNTYPIKMKQQKQRRPHVSYAELITLAIESSQKQMLTLKEIYVWIAEKYPYFNNHKIGWQNSIRHNLSLNRSFYKVPRAEGSRGKGSYWKINYDFQNAKINYRTKRFNYNNEIQTQNLNSLNELLNDNNRILDNIGVNEIPYKQTTIFNGNLTEEEYFAMNQEYNNMYPPNEDKKHDRIFSFK